MYYVAHRLFAAQDRALAARLADRLANEVGADNVFLPFCDTDEEDLVAQAKGRRLFELDRERLCRLTAMIAILHGPSLDDGVCMEIGYAGALGTPVIVMTTDFQTYSMTGAGTPLSFPDPLVECLASRVVRGERLGSPSSTLGISRFEAFEERNREQIERTVKETVDATLGVSAHRTTALPVSGARPRTAFVEPSPYGGGESAIGGVLTRAGYALRTATRLSATDAMAAVRNDWAAATASEVFVADVSGPETPPGAAVLIGAAAALGRQVAAYQPRPVFTHAHGREPNWRNLMIQYASGAHITSAADLAAWTGV
ncbi:nucleoside 2-deoxyribosyltransferase [Streptomyces sp. NPDC006923]|uniref:nucleoside 2-deoxyribosyltransferase n=1 Tax=Streptomyces sp. NPDC006923 TaxID=3155355 RepID=UPI0033FD2755